jgi:hypothetical protein
MAMSPSCSRSPACAPALPGDRRDKRLGLVLALASLAALLGAVVLQARGTPTTPFDEPLWFARSLVLPSDASDPDYRAWAVDVPAVNRWVYYAVLHATGLDEIPPGEPRCWSMRGGELRWYGKPLPKWVREYYSDVYYLEWWDRNFGPYCPRRAVMAMRYTNIAFFALFAALLWCAAAQVLSSRLWATAAVLPILLAPTCLRPIGISFVTWSGDVFMAAAMSAALAVWLRYHLKGRGASASAIVAVGILCGLAVASKHTGVLLVAAYAVYLALTAKGLGRLLRPLAALLVAASVAALLNPIVFLYPGASPWQVIEMAADRRASVLARQLATLKPCPWGSLMAGAFYWWPLVPAALAAVWACRRERWFAPVALWCGFLAGGAGAGLLRIRVMQERYALPLLTGFAFLSCVCAITAARKARSGPGAAEQGHPDRAGVLKQPSSADILIL